MPRSKVAKIAPQEPSRFVLVPGRSGAPVWVDPVAVTCLEGDPGPRIYVMGGHSYEASNSVTAADILALIAEKE